MIACIDAADIVYPLFYGDLRVSAIIHDGLFV